MNGLVFIPLEGLTTPKTGKQVMVDYWWVVHPEKGAAFHQRGRYKSPQCNQDKTVTDYLFEKMYADQGMEVRLIPMAFLDIEYD